MIYRQTPARLWPVRTRGGTKELAIREILQLGNPLLWQPSSAVTDPRSSETAAIIADLASTLADFRSRFKFGRAIAAPQIGVHRRVLVVNLGEREPLINPEIVSTSDEMMELWDDCFSFPDLMVRVRRHREVSVRYTDCIGVERYLDAVGDLSELLQHEIDHLDGVLAVDRAIDAHSFALRKEVDRLRSSARD